MIYRLNNFSRQCLEQGDLDPAFKVLKKCEVKLQKAKFKKNKTEIFSMTLSNLGMYYRIKNKPLIAVRYLQQALEHELKDETTPLLKVAQTKLNICAVLS
jgi:tetratricopeptide (TPR) repeat protein